MLKKYINGSWSEVKYKKYGNKAEEFVEFPVTIKSDGNDLTDYIISGNMSQASGVSPTTPIQPQETGERTGNICDESTLQNGYFDTTTYQYYPNENYRCFSLLLQAGTYTIFAKSDTLTIRLLRVSSTSLGANAVNLDNRSYTFTLPVSETIYVSLRNSTTTNDFTGLTIMLNTGSTALPYEPYGIKIPISSGGENLFDKNATDKDTTGYIQSDGSIIPSQNYYVSGYIDISDLSNVTISGMGTGVNPAYCLYNANKQYVSGNKYNNVETITVNITTEHYIRFSYRAANENTTMLNLGSEPLPYSPYNRTTTPIYLGEVESTRRVKKLVLTGKENWSVENNNVFNISGLSPITGYYQAYNSHYVFASSYTDVDANNNTFSISSSRLLIHDDSCSTPSDFKTYLQQRYAAGTPVTVWYVLATPETAVVNEPLRKIGDYADTLSMEQAGVQIPTLHGNTVIDVETTLNPSEMTLNWHGWHVADVKEYSDGGWR